MGKSENSVVGVNTFGQRSCRVCGSSGVRSPGTVEYFEGFRSEVFECQECYSFMTTHDSSVHELFHQSGAISYYFQYRQLAEKTKDLFDRKQTNLLRDYLTSYSSKYRFAIEEAEKLPSDARILEVGCSRGYLTSWFISSGRQILGMDVSREAIDSASAAFGRHFVLADSPEIAGNGPYDLIFHVGMIGCVPDPVGLTKDLLNLLKPGGRLIFNAPNRQSCYLKGQLWTDSAPPPDLVTLFTPGIWKRLFASEADVRETVENCPPEQSLRILLRRLFGLRWKPPEPNRISVAATEPRSHGQQWSRHWLRFEGLVVRCARVTGLIRLTKCQPYEFGLFVDLQKKSRADVVTG